MLGEINFEILEKPDADELIAFYERQHCKTTSERDKLVRMIEQSFCFVTARREGELIGLARGVTDGVTGRLAECKLDPGFQGPACITRTGGRIEHDASGIAREMAERVIHALADYGVERIDTLAYGTEVDFCEELGFKKLRGVVPMELPVDSEAAVVQSAGIEESR